jgi:dienelactone hydrolase
MDDDLVGTSTPSHGGTDSGRAPLKRARRTIVYLVAAALFVIVVNACTGSAQGRIAVDESSALFDDPLHVHISGVRPGQEVTVNASTTDVTGRLWQSTATFAAGPDGSVDVASATPVSGSYEVASATGLLWSMAPSDADDYYFVPAAATFTVTLALVVDGTAVAATHFDRLIAAAGVRSQTVSLDHDGVYGAMYEPADTTNQMPAILILGGSEGGLSGGDKAAALASHGYPALALAYFGEPGLPPTLSNVPLEYFATALRWLARQPGVDPGRIIVEGVSRGSEAALLLGVTYPELVHAVIAAVPSSTVFSGLPDITKPAWTLQGTPIPFATSTYGYQTAIPPAAVIPVERIRGPIFLLCGEFDKLWPSCTFTHEITNRLVANNFGYPVIALAEPGAGHAVGSLLPNRATSSGFVTSARYGRLNLGGSRSDDALGRLDAWPRLLAFLAGL